MTESPPRPATEAEQLLDADKVGELLGMDRVTVLRKAKRRQIGCVRDGRLVKFRAEHVAEYIAAHEQAAKPIQRPAPPSVRGR